MSRETFKMQDKTQTFHLLQLNATICQIVPSEPVPELHYGIPLVKEGVSPRFKLAGSYLTSLGQTPAIQRASSLEATV